jgi:hypothetical protein
MTYCIRGLEPEQFIPLFELDDAALAAQGARRIVADAERGYPCRVSLEDAKAGETLILLNHVSNDTHGPYRAAHAIFVREEAAEAAAYVGATPPAFAWRTLSLRSFTSQGEMIDARLAGPEEHDSAIRELLAEPAADHIDAHNAARGCFAARIERYRRTQ